jgi:hypothetical protein
VAHDKKAAAVIGAAHPDGAIYIRCWFAGGRGTPENIVSQKKKRDNEGKYAHG